MGAHLLRLAASAFVALFLYLVPFYASADMIFDTAPLTITTADGKVHAFTVELAVNSEQRAQGLMNRRKMAADRGMLFDFGESRQVMMWMRNTYLPLDMLFIAKDGTVQTVREDAAPLSEAIIDSNVPVAFVLELNGGTARLLGITPGALIDSPRISQPSAEAKP